MSCQITAGDESINVTDTSWLVVSLCRPWFDSERDCDGDGYHQVQVAASSVIEANKFWPVDTADLVAKLHAEENKLENPLRITSRLQHVSASREEYTENFVQQLIEARKFIYEAALGNHYIDISH